MEWQPWIFKCVLTASLCVSCATQKVDRSMGKHSAHEGQVYADEVLAQSPFETVNLSWREARELMKVRNPAYRKAALSYNRATSSTPAVKNLRTHLGGSIGETIKGVVNPEDLALTLKEPVTGIPKQFESISSLKDVNHKMAHGEWVRKESEIVSEKKMREQVVRLHALFRRSETIERNLKWVESLQGDGKIDAAAQKDLAKFEAKLKADRKVWLNEVRDFFNAEYYDVKFVQENSKMSDYRNLAQPDFTEWKRWGTLSRVESLAGVLKKEHADSKPMIPGTDLVRDRLSMMMNDGGTKLDAELDTQSVRNSVRKLIRSWRSMKLCQQKAEDLKAQMKPLEDSAEVGKDLIAKRSQLYGQQQEEIQHAKVVWMMDEKCWAD